MGIICGTQVVAINTSSNTVACGHQIKIDDIRPGYSTIDVLIDGYLIVPQVGIAAIALDGNILTIRLLSKNESGGTASINFTVSTDPCVGIVCNNTCVGTDLYSQRCSVIYDGNSIPTGHECVHDQLIGSCAPTLVLDSILPPIATIQVNTIQQFTAKDQNGNTITTGVIWAIQSGVGSIDSTGLYSAGPTSGSAIISATYQGITLMAPITVNPVGVNQYKLYFKAADIFPAWYVDSVLGAFRGIAEFNLKMLTDYYVDDVTFNADNHIITVTIKSVQGLTLVMGSDGKVYSMIAPVIVGAFWVLFIAASIAAIVGSLWLQFFGMEASVAGLEANTRAITANAQICTANATTGAITCAAISDSNMIVVVKMTAGDKTETKEITTITPSVTFSVPTNVDIGIIGSVKNNSNYAVYEATDESLKACISGGQCPTTIPITIKLQSKADGTTSPTITKTDGSPGAGKYTLFIKTSAGHMVEDGSGDLEADGSVPKTRIPSDQEYCILVIPDDFPTHPKVWGCFEISAGEDSAPDLTALSCEEEKNKVSIRTVYIGTSGALIAFIPDNIDIMEGTNPIPVKTRTKDDPVEANRAEEVTIISGLEKAKTYTVHITSSYTIKSAYQDQQVTFDTDCNTTTLITVEAEAPANTYDITIEVKNSVTLTPLQGATVTLGSLTDHVTGSSGMTLFAAVPSGTHDLKVALVGYKSCTGTPTCPKSVNVTGSRTVSVHLDVDQVLSDVDTRISNFGTIGDVIATKSVKIKGDLEYLEGTTYHPLTDAQIDVEIKDASNTTIQTLSAVTQKGILGIGSGHFETGEWLVPESLVNTQISVITTFAGVGQYKSLTFTKTYAVAKAADCAIPIPFTNSCLLSKETGTGLLMIGGVLIGGYILYKISGAIPKAKAAVTEVRATVAEKMMPSEEELARLEQRRLAKERKRLVAEAV